MVRSIRVSWRNEFFSLHHRGFGLLRRESRIRSRADCELGQFGSPLLRIVNPTLQIEHNREQS